MANDTGSITFVQNHRPPLTAGEYIITVEQDLLNKHPQRSDGGDTISESYINTRRFAVRGQRFALDPTEFNTLFPPPDNQGEYENVLPHVVLNSRTLPWERSTDTTNNGAPWLTLLLFDGADPPPAVQSVQIGDLQRDDFLRSQDDQQKSKSTLPADAVSYVDGYQKLGLTFGLDYGQNYYDRCQVIDVPIDRFSAIAPSAPDLPWLAHARTVGLRAKAGVQQPATGDFSVIVGNRLPDPNSKCTVHLVSLEGMSAFLPKGDDYATSAIKLPGGIPARLIRLVSLRSWSFASVDPAQNFAGYLKSLDTGALQISDIVRGSSAAEQAVANALAMGYTALNHHTRQGDHTVSWYRGPLVPFTVKPTIFVPGASLDASTPAQPTATSDELMRYDPSSGMFDVSYAAAWQLGRLLALQNSSFSVALYKWKQSVLQQTALAVEQQVIKERFGKTLGLPQDQLTALDSVNLRQAAATFIVTTLKSAILSAERGPRVSGAGGVTMQPLQPRKMHFERLAALVSSPERLAKVHATTLIPSEILQWLGRLRLLYGVPFNYLVPDEKMLPMESIRFFQVDPNWLYSLVEGAYSIGRSTTGDLAHDAVFAALVHAGSTEAARQVRAKLQTSAASVEHITGFLLRSSVVRGWPGLEVNAYDTSGTSLANVLRMERLSPTILLFMVEGLIHHVDIKEPAEGLHFGVNLTGDKQLRYVTVPPNAPAGKHPGDEIANTSAGKVPYRAARVIKIDQLASTIRDALVAANANNDSSTGQARPFTSAEFGLEMIEGVQDVRFVNDKSDRI